MVLGLLTANLIAQVGLVVAFIFGYLTSVNHAYFQYHFMFALPASLLAVFAHCMTMFYFIGTGKQIKDICKEHDLNRSFVNRTRQFKSKSFPYMTGAIALTMAVTVVGGGVLSRAVPSVIHTALAYLALLFNFATLVVELKYLAANNILLDEISQSIMRSQK